MKLKRVIQNVVYWSTLVGPIYSLISGTIRGFIAAVQNIREEEKQKAEKYMFVNPDEIEVDLSQSSEALNFSQVVNFIDRKENKE
uniref:Uncharacterized protein n=1 Tax=Dulem virus 90 TaxID=3145801 RepID=A0AAU8B4H6_9VIRU